MHPPPFFLALIGVIVGIELGLATRELAVQTIAPIWPAAGISFAIFCIQKKNGFLPVILGHLWLWLKVDLTERPILLLLPLLYAAEAWFAARLRHLRPVWTWGVGDSQNNSSWNNLAAPTLSCLTVTGIICLLVTSVSLPGVSGRMDQLLPLWIMVFSSHLHGIVAFGPLLFHCFNDEMSGKFSPRKRNGLCAGIAALLLVSVAGVPEASSGGLHVLIVAPIPLMILAGRYSGEAQASVLCAIWCTLTTVLSLFPGSPFQGQLGNAAISAQLPIYNIVIVGLTYGAALAGSNLKRQLASKDLAMTLAEIHPWEWISRCGYTIPPALGNDMNGRPIIPDLSTLKGEPSGEALDSDQENDWRNHMILRAEDTGTDSRHIDLSGRILSRDHSGRPLHVIGLLRDVTSEEKNRERALRMDTEKALLRKLHANLNRHFLFNSLNMIKALIHEDQERASEATTSLAALMRNNLRNTEELTVPMIEEFRQIRMLLKLAKLRFEERLTYSISFPDRFQDVQVPPMLLLNLVENALTHGIRNSPSGGGISITVTEAEAGMLRITITNPGTLRKENSLGMGIGDAVDRLSSLFPNRSSLELTESYPGTISATATFPHQT